MAACFPELLRWMRELWTPCEEEAEPDPPQILALNPTHHRGEWVALVVGVAAHARESWTGHFCHLLRQLAPAVPDRTPVHVLRDQGLGSPDLWQQIVDLGWHQVLRYPSHITFHPTGGIRVPARHADRAPCPGPRGPLAPDDRHPVDGDRRRPVCLPPLD